MRIRLPKSRARRYTLFLGTAIVLFFGSLFLLRWNTYRQSAAELRAIVDRLDRDDPNWEWESYLSNRKPIADEENSFAIIDKVLAQPNFGRYDHDPNINRWRVLPEKMPFEIADWAGQFAGDRKGAIKIARQLAHFPNGRHPIKYAEDFIGTLLPTVQETRAIANLLQWDIRVNAQLGHFDLCVQDIRAMRNTARSFGDEGFLIVMLVRIAIDAIMVRSVQEVLAQGEISDRDLLILQKEILEESRELILAQSLRGERASLFKMMKFCGSNISMSSYKLIVGLSNGGPGPNSNGWHDNPMLVFVSFRYPPSAQADQANMLRKMTGFIEASKLPFAERTVRIDEIVAQAKADHAKGFQAKSLLTNMLLPGVEKVAQAETRWRAFMRSTVMGLAAERFRLANQRWPKTLDELVPKYVERVEEDPYTGKPLIYKMLDDGIVIYGIGQNGIDDGGDVNGEVLFEGKERGDYDDTKVPTDTGIRLWNKEKRGK